MTLLVVPMAANSESSNLANVQFVTADSVISMQDLKGQVVYVDFWASWCGPCVKSFPWMNNIQQKYSGKGLKIIAVNVDVERELATEFLQNHPAQFSIAFDSEGKLAELFEVKGMPSSYLIDRNGNIVFTHVGFRASKLDEYEGHIQQLLGAGGDSQQ